MRIVGGVAPVAVGDVAALPAEVLSAAHRFQHELGVWNSASQRHQNELTAVTSHPLPAARVWQIWTDAAVAPGILQPAGAEVRGIASHGLASRQGFDQRRNGDGTAGGATRSLANGQDHK